MRKKGARGGLHLKKDSAKRLKGSVLLFIELLIVLAVIAYLFYVLLNTYFKKSSIEIETEKTLSGQGPAASSDKGVLDSTKNKVEDINKKIRSRTEVDTSK